MNISATTVVPTSYSGNIDCLTIFPAYIRFGDVSVGGSLRKKVQISNPLDQEIELKAFSLKPDFSISSNKPLKIKPGETLEIYIIFSPTNKDYQVSQIRFNSDSSCRVSITVSGSGK